MSAPGGRERRPRISRRPPSRLSLRVEPSDAGALLLAFCVRRGAIPLEEARASIDRGGAYVDGKRIYAAQRELKAGETVELHLRERGEAPKAEALSPERILHLDAELIAVDKPAGVLAQEGLAGGPDLPSLTTQLLLARGEASATALLVHRLDRGTTGVTLLARTKSAQTVLLDAFRDGKVEKEYLALCAVPPAQLLLADETFEVDLALGADENAAGRRKPDPLGQPAKTHFLVLQRWPGAALLSCFPKTGRTHQIRVHLASVGLPLLGDARYGGPRLFTRADGERLDLTRPMLHAHALQTQHPAGGALNVEAPPPADLLAAIAFLDGAAAPRG